MVSYSDAYGKVFSEKYDKLVLAQGSIAVKPSGVNIDSQCINTLHSLDHLRFLHQKRASILNKRKTPEWAIIGGGLIGCEVAASLALAGDKVTIYQSENRLMNRQFMEEQSKALYDFFVRKGVVVNLSAIVKKVFYSVNGILVENNGNQAEFDIVLAAIGYQPDIGLAKQCGLKYNKGIVVNEQLQTSNANIYALGDVSEFNGKVSAFISPNLQQAEWLSNHLLGTNSQSFSIQEFPITPKVQGFDL